jgi:hypothetical protein
MGELTGVDYFLWGLSVLAQLILLASLLLRKDHREFPAFLAYISAALLQACILFFAYRIWDFHKS